MSEAGSTYQVGTTWSRDVNGHQIVLSVGVDCYGLAVWSGPNRLDGWVANYPTKNEGAAEARRVRALIEEFGSIREVERYRDDLLSELRTVERRTDRPSRARAVRIDNELTRIESLADRAGRARLFAETDDFLSTTV